ncbi:hypothetical protein Glove_318g15 [Diversispora epigaea]|uniref:BTB domain-containing protein n=1 Tax=Diversispora epigaea TaxID=1348612 RepID=A0A397HQ22_9GLOM|nr:hypothetical protein Glove_318g15 [Diversispora epigaea]
MIKYLLSEFGAGSDCYQHKLYFSKLSQNSIELLNDKDDYNVIIKVENKEKTFTAHSNVLKCRSPYFHRELETLAPNNNNIKTIIKSSISAQIFDVILKYIHGGIAKLKNYCVVKYPNLIFDNSSALISLLKRDDLQKKEHLLSPKQPVKSNILTARTVADLLPRQNEPKEHFSIIISEDHAAKISTWIDRKTTTYTSTNNPYKFELILSGTRDGIFAMVMLAHSCRVKNPQNVIVNRGKNRQKNHGPYFWRFLDV